MNAEQIKNQAIVEYAVNELNNIFRAAQKEKEFVETSKTFVNAMSYNGDTGVFKMYCGYVHVDIRHAIARQDDAQVRVYDVDGLGGGVTFPVDVVYSWLEQLKKD